MGVIPKGNLQNQNTEGQTPAFSESDGKGTAEKQGDLGSGEDANDSPLPLQFEINGSNVHSSSGKTAIPAAQLIKSDLPESKIVSMARPLGLGVDSKVKSKIWANQYVELHSLLSSKTNEKIELR